MLLPPAPDTRDRVLHAGLRERLAMIQTILAIYAFTTLLTLSLWSCGMSWIFRATIEHCCRVRHDLCHYRCLSHIAVYQARPRAAARTWLAGGLGHFPDYQIVVVLRRLHWHHI